MEITQSVSMFTHKHDGCAQCDYKAEMLTEALMAIAELSREITRFASGTSSALAPVEEANGQVEQSAN